MGSLNSEGCGEKAKVDGRGDFPSVSSFVPEGIVVSSIVVVGEGSSVAIRVGAAEEAGII